MAQRKHKKNHFRRKPAEQTVLLIVDHETIYTALSLEGLE